MNAAHLDANEVGFLQRELATIQSQVYETEFAELKAFKLFPISNEGRFEDNILTYRQTNKTGTAAIIGDNVDDLPRVDIKRSEFHNPNRVIGNSFAYTVREIRAASKLGRSLNASMAVAAREAQEQLMNRIAFYGDEEYGLTGLLSSKDIPRYLVEQGASGKRPWAEKTPDEILDDLNGITTRLYESTLGIEQPDTLILPVEQYAHIASKRIQDINTTILEFFQRNNPFIKNIEWAHELKGAETDGDKGIMVAYKRDVQKLALHITHPFEILPEQRSNLEFRYPCISSTAGLILYRPKSLLIAERI